ncbi:hypothetical protein F2P81_010179 [Scophthalmus maximus]|uniref:Uncharacterized protein n=1 Tax=Scophthalmus maximus TaxID=52904 RepID=A0A6A4SX57_SCOMX|nr:hypothetical protein F2P81_010179 [Scophthalmus maximus]
MPLRSYALIQVARYAHKQSLTRQGKYIFALNECLINYAVVSLSADIKKVAKNVVTQADDIPKTSKSTSELSRPACRTGKELPSSPRRYPKGTWTGESIAGSNG